MLDAARFEEGGGVDLAAGAEPLYPTGGGGVDLGEGLPRCPGKPVFIGITGLLGLFEWSADKGWGPCGAELGNIPDV